jgi:type VI secretion system protein ImpK
LPYPTNGSPPDLAHTENLALIFENLLTAIVRLRSGKQEVASAEAFRKQVLEAIKAANQTGRARGYTDEDIRLAVFAVVAFLDESILNLRQPGFQDWVRKPLQEELFGRHVAGEVFFHNIEQLLGRRDSPEVADVLEVCQLAILLGYLGRYSIASKSELKSITEKMDDKIVRIRKSTGDLSPHWRIPPEGARHANHDPWTRRFTIAAGACALLVLLLFGGYRAALNIDASAVEQLAARGSK